MTPLVSGGKVRAGVPIETGFIEHLEYPTMVDMRVIMI
jgi:hypothetical protein